MADYTDALEADFRRASDELAKAKPTSQGGIQAETRYAVAYEALVRAGLAPRLRGKYRLVRR
jgi:hypothetical protein